MCVSKCIAATYAVGKYFNGWKLLRNPKGLSEMQLSFVKSFDSIDFKTLDRYSNNTIITRKFTEGCNSTVRRVLATTKYPLYDNNSTKLCEKTKKTFLKTGESVRFAEKKDFDDTTIENRDFSGLSKVVKKIVRPASRSESNEKFVNITFANKVCFDYILSGFKRQKVQRQSLGDFLKILFHNLMGSKDKKPFFNTLNL